MTPTTWRHHDVLERGTAPGLADGRPCLGHCGRSGDGGGCGQLAHLTVSNDLVRQNETPEIVATTKKMTIAKALASA